MAKYSVPPTDLKKLTKPQLEVLIRGVEETFPQDVFGSGLNMGLTEPYTTFDGLFHWSTTKDFFVYITNLTGTSDIRSASNVLYETVTKAPEFSEWTTTKAPEQTVESTTPDKWTREAQEIERQKREAESKESKAGVKESVEKSIKTKEELAAKAALKEASQQKPPILVDKTPQPTQPIFEDQPVMSAPPVSYKQGGKQSVEIPPFVTQEVPEQRVSGIPAVLEPQLRKPKTFPQKGAIKEATQPILEEQRAYTPPVSDEQGEIQAALKDKKVVVTPVEELPKVTLTPKEKEQIWNLAQAVKINKDKAQVDIEEKIREAVEKSIKTKEELAAKEALRERAAKGKIVEGVRTVSLPQDQKVTEKDVTTEAQKQQIWAKLQEENPLKIAPKDTQKTVIKELSGQKIYAVPDEKPQDIIFSKNEQKLIAIAKTNPELFTEKLSALIVAKNPDIPSEVIEPLSKIIAVDVTKSLADPSAKPVPIGVFAAVSKASEYLPNISVAGENELAKTTSLFTTLSENQGNLYRTVLLRSVGANITNDVLGSPEATYHLSETPSEGSFSLKLDQLQTSSFSLQEGYLSNTFNSPTFDLAKSAAGGKLKDFAFSKLQSIPKDGFLGRISSFANSRAFDNIAPFIGAKTNFNYIGTNFFGKAVARFLPEYAPLISNLAGKLGFDIGISAIAPVATEVASVEGAAILAGGTTVKNVAGGFLGKAIVAIAPKLAPAVAAISATVSTALQGLNAIIPGLGVVAATAVTWLITKIPWEKIMPFLIGGAALAIAGPVVGVVAGVGTFVLISGGVGTATLGTIGFGIANFFGTLGRAFVTAVATPIIVTLLVIPVLVALILFIINSGAYIVPLGGSETGGGSASCVGASAPKPVAVNTIFSADGKYVFPLANANNTSLSCTHWDKSLATDIFTENPRGDQYPVLAYTSGVIYEISLNDSLGGKYVVLKGTDGRYYYYAHNCALYVKAGDSVSVGDVIATTDNTGSAANTPEHSHFAISNAPSFGFGGSICPSKDFEDKFNLGRCNISNECIP